MRGIAAFVVLLLAVAAHAQGPRTRTKKGPRPSRRGDNTDVGLPSGKDVPDGMRRPFAPPAGGAAPPPPVAAAAAPPPRAAAAAPPPRATAPPPPVRAAAPPPPARGAAPPPAARPMGRPGDNTDVGLPSGADVPDGRRMPITRTRSGPPPVRRMPVYTVPAAAPPPAPKPVMFNPWAAPAPPVPAAPVPVLSCEAQCPVYWQPVCSVYGNSYDNDCRLGCSGEPYSCEGQCPCEEPKVAPAAPIVDPFMGFFDNSCNCPATYDPVCTESGDEKDNACIAQCDGHKVNCDGQCPC